MFSPLSLSPCLSCHTSHIQCQIKLDKFQNIHLNKQTNKQEETGVWTSSLCCPAFLLWERSRTPPRLMAVTDDHDRMFMVLKESGLDYVAVMPPHIAGQWSNSYQTLFPHAHRFSLPPFSQFCLLLSVIFSLSFPVSFTLLSVSLTSLRRFLHLSRPIIILVWWCTSESTSEPRTLNFPPSFQTTSTWLRSTLWQRTCWREGSSLSSIWLTSLWSVCRHVTGMGNRWECVGSMPNHEDTKPSHLCFRFSRKVYASASSLIAPTNGSFGFRLFFSFFYIAFYNNALCSNHMLFVSPF